ncbi:hypothetical protein PR002_g24187 [Phytophthora rubi]|uniref:Uncharacterized protein n=1 Tax=Phytophthora rubi TaxID=129364 RepID=A0A6A3IE53_9STRA|nr:hypothetical protein PR002_g24187 [Phytophthora rubi]
MATYDPTELDYWNGNQEAEACVQQAASVITARDKESAPEHDYDDAKPEVEACVQQATSVTTACDKESAPKYDYNDVKHEVDACAQPATSVTTARDERSAPEPDCDYTDYNYENPEVEACAQQATSTLAARDEESALVPEHDHDEEEQEAGVCSPQAASVIEARDSKSVLTPDEEDETKTETVAGVCTPLGAAVTTNPDENPATRAESDGSVSAVRVLFKRPVCDPDPDRTVVYESFGCNTGWGLARAALAAQESAAQAEADEESLCEVSPSSDSRRTGESKGGTTTVNSASTTPDPLVAERPPTESILSEEDGLSPSPVPKHPSTESILSKEDGNNLGPALKLQRSVTTEDEQLIEKLVREVVDAYTTNATLIQSKVVERRSRCPRCRSLTKLPKRGGAAKRVSFDCSSLFSTRSEAFGSNGSRHDREDGVFDLIDARMLNWLGVEMPRYVHVDET